MLNEAYTACIFAEQPRASKPLLWQKNVSGIQPRLEESVDLVRAHGLLPVDLHRFARARRGFLDDLILDV